MDRINEIKNRLIEIPADIQELREEQGDLEDELFDLENG